MARLRKFMFERVYLGEAARREQQRVTPSWMPCSSTTWPRRKPSPPSLPKHGDPVTRVVDYLAGMTDRFCIREFSASRCRGPRD